MGLAEWLAIGAGEGVSIHCLCPEGVRTGMTRGDSAAVGCDMLEPEAAAAIVFDAMERGDFLVTTHPRTAEFERRRVGDRTRWISGMRRARAAALGETALFQEAQGR